MVTTGSNVFVVKKYVGAFYVTLHRECASWPFSVESWSNEPVQESNYVYINLFGVVSVSNQNDKGVKGADLLTQF